MLKWFIFGLFCSLVIFAVGKTLWDREKLREKQLRLCA
jgi:hypothetical protein